jgi:hypothetical protein
MTENSFNPDHTVTSFVLDILSTTQDLSSGPRYYVEIGAGHYKDGNNSYVLEKDHGWHGVSFDIDEAFVNEFNGLRSNPCLLQDAQTFDYANYFKEQGFPNQIDFLQLDIEDSYDHRGQDGDNERCLRALIAVPLNTYRFSVITFEHNLIQNFKNDWIRDVSRRILDSFGYALVAKLPHEDWWVDPNVVPFQNYKNFFNLNSNWRD